MIICARTAVLYLFSFKEMSLMLLGNINFKHVISRLFLVVGHIHSLSLVHCDSVLGIYLSAITVGRLFSGILIVFVGGANRCT
jgi:hypothetical protein